MDKLKTTMENGNTERANLKSEIQNLKAEETDTKIENLNALNQKESDARTFFNRDLEKRCSQIESDIEKVVLEDSDPALEELAEKTLPENLVAGKNRILAFAPSELEKQNDLEVTSHDNISIKPNYHSNAPHSVLNTEHKTEDQTNNQQLLNNS